MCVCVCVCKNLKETGISGVIAPSGRSRALTILLLFFFGVPRPSRSLRLSLALLAKEQQPSSSPRERTSDLLETTLDPAASSILFFEEEINVQQLATSAVRLFLSPRRNNFDSIFQYAFHQI